MSMDAAAMDLSNAFEFGQGYVALSRIRRLSGLYISGWNETVFQVHPLVLEKDLEFRRLSNEADNTFSKIEAREIKKMHDNFTLFCGGDITVNNNKVERKSRRKSKSKGDTYEETFMLWREGKSADEIASNRGLNRGTIVEHLCRLYKKRENC
jgi:hypothetical protein